MLQCTPPSTNLILIINNKNLETLLRFLKMLKTTNWWLLCEAWRAVSRHNEQKEARNETSNGNPEERQGHERRMLSKVLMANPEQE
jgi:hypothetical protein